MYEDFYGFAQSPFALAPDPRFLYLSDSHEEAIRLLRQAIRRREGFIVLTGDIGTGKTTLCRALIEQLDQATFTSLILTPFVTTDELLREVLLDFGIVSRDAIKTGKLASATTHDLIATLHEFLLSLHPIGGVAVLIIDEAQHVSPAVLEQIRVLSNLETNDAKLLQIVLVGQLDLLATLGAAGMRQLDQRISLRAMLKPLSRAELEAYVGHRLDIARGSGRPTAFPTIAFDAAALDAIHFRSGGVPRVVNLICDRALMAGAEAGTATITAATVRQAMTMLGLTPADAGAGRRLPAWATTVLALVVLAGVGAAAALVLTPAERFVAAPAPALPVSPEPVRAAPPIQAKAPPDTRPPLYPPLSERILPAAAVGQPLVRDPPPQP